MEGDSRAAPVSDDISLAVSGMEGDGGAAPVSDDVSLAVSGMEGDGGPAPVMMSFLLVGHTKFAPDWCFRLFKAVVSSHFC